MVLKSLTAITTTAVLLGVLPFNLANEQQEYDISGVIYSPDNEPVEGLTVELLDEHKEESLATDTTDADGHYSLSATITSAESDEPVEEASEFELGDTYPNPTGGQTNLPFRVSDEGTYNIEVFTSDGRLMISRQEHLAPGMHTAHLAMPQTAGTYIIRVRGEGVSDSRQVTSLAGGGARLEITSGTNQMAQFEEPETQEIFDFTVLTLKVHGTDEFAEFSTTIDEPGEQQHDINLQSAEEAACENLELAESSARPSNLVEVDGIGDGLGDEPLAWVYDAAVDEPGEEDRHLALIDTEEESSGELIVPIHPDDYMDGGEAKIVIFSDDESVTCDPIPFTIEPLDPAPGTLETVVDQIEDSFKSHAEAFGYSTSELMDADPEELPLHIGAIAAGLQSIGSDDFENNIRSFLAGDAPIIEEEDIQKDEEGSEVLDAIIAESGLSAEIQAITNELSDWEDVTLPENNQERRVPDGITEAVNHPAQLDDWMRHQARCAEIDDTPATAVAGAATAAAAFIPGAQGAAAISGATITIIDLILGLCNASLPSELQDIELEADPVTFNEDELGVGSWYATMTATNEGFTFTWPDVIGLAPGAGDLARYLGRAAGHLQRALEMSDDILNYMHELIETAWGLSEDSGPIQFESNVWGPVDVDPNRENGDHDEEEYFSWQLTTVESEDDETDPFAFQDDDELLYETRFVGISSLLVQTRADVFQDEHSSADTELGVEAIEVSIEELTTEESPPFIIGEDDDYEIDLWAAVSNADDRSVEWEILEGDGASIETSGTYDQNATFTAPEDGDTYLVQAESVTEEGLREGLEPSRSDEAIIRIEGEGGPLSVDPDPGCLPMDEDHEFTATLGDDEVSMDQLAWSQSGPGEIDEDGVYSSDEEGFVSIEFWEAGDPDNVYTVEFNVRESCGNFIVTLTSDSDDEELEFEYDCAGARAITGFGPTASAFLTNQRTFTFEGESAVVEIELDLFETDISQEGEWTKEVSQGSMGIRVYDDDDNDIQPFPAIGAVVHREEIEETVGGETETVGSFYGEFAGQFDTGEEIITAEGEFSEILYGEFGCGPLSHPGWDDIFDELSDDEMSTDGFNSLWDNLQSSME